MAKQAGLLQRRTDFHRQARDTEQPLDVVEQHRAVTPGGSQYIRECFARLPFNAPLRCQLLARHRNLTFEF
ncbi:MAG: hypothetical protein K2Y71_06430 [Xanthobacteraceae bacterium]|nr:hypothetical protein [Xanthobacteraceae bacterium]